ncbi:MAG TPA: type II toxin-antitoxin system VapC family toxin [Thermoanaerobaculia bacterium]|nr:type II toxin-antitoxin system VapC family toxin [Thermoanaerobaculia bacterium]
MIGVDTNVLVRYLTQDDASQARRSGEMIERAEAGGDAARVDVVVLCELVWVLRSAYRYRKDAIVGSLEQILSTAAFSFENRDLLRVAVDAYREGAGDFADYVIGLRNARAGCDHTVTLDRALRGERQFVVL